MRFKDFNNKIKIQSERMFSSGRLYRADIDTSELWDIYIKSFKKDDNPIFRDPNSSVHQCNCCKNFIRRYGNIVSVTEDGTLESLFSNLGDCGEYTNSSEACNKAIISSKIKDVFFESYDELNRNLNYEKTNKSQSVYKLGIETIYKQYSIEEEEKYGYIKSDGSYIVDFDKVYEFDHFYIELPKKFVSFGDVIPKDSELYSTNQSLSQIIAYFRDKHNVFKRCLLEIKLDILILAKELINQGSLLDGKAHLHAVEDMIIYKTGYDKLLKEGKNVNNLIWVTSYDIPERVAKFKNTLIGKFCSDLSDGIDINKACVEWNKNVDPVNYMKAKSPITDKQIKEAKKYVEENGYIESFNRRLATIDDIIASEILHMSNGDGKIKEISIFDNIKTSHTQHKKVDYDKVEEVCIEKFMKDILPTATSIEAMFENRMVGNLVTMTKAVSNTAKRITKWTSAATNYSWSYNGNLAGKSQLTQMVEEKGGRVDGVFRFTHSWNEIEPNQSLMDLHVFMPGCEFNDNLKGHFYTTGQRVGWNNRTDHKSGGTQDVDYVHQAPIGYVPVENITFPELSKLPEGVYTCRIHNWSFRKTGGRGKAEIAFEGNIYQYIYPSTKNNEWVTVAEVTLKNGKFSIKHCLPVVNDTKKVWNIDTNKFHKVNLVCKSPNHWSENNIGNLHYFFMLENCKTDKPVRSFHNENLTTDLLKHRKVLEVLGSQSLIEPTEKQLSGLGFNSTIPDELLVKVKGSSQRMFKIKF